MILKGILDNDHINYKKISMVLEFPYCTFKCEKECGKKMCQNAPIINYPDIDIDINKIINMYCSNPLTEAIVMQGLEPMDSFSDVYKFIEALRIRCNDDIVIYTGYNKNEIIDKIEKLEKFENIIIKFGRYIPDQEPHFDEVLKVKLASNNQYAEVIS